MTRPWEDPGYAPRPSGFRRRLYQRVADPANLPTIPVIGLFFLLRPLGLIAPIPYWSIAALILGAAVLNTVVIASLPEAHGGWPLVCRVGVEMGVIAAVVYGIGWGPILAVGFVFCAADVMRANSSAVAKPAIIWTFVFVGLGQLAIFLGLAPTLISEPLVHGLAVLGALGAVFTIKVLQWFAQSREASEARFRALVQNASDIVVVVDSSRCFSYVSPSFTRTLGWPADHFKARPAGDLLHPDDHQRLWAQFAADTDGMNPAHRSEVRLQHADGTWRWFEATVSNHLDDPDVGGIVANLHDITDRKVLENELRHQAFHDSLTGLANRALFSDRVEHALARQHRTGEPLAVLLVDIDDFKAVNDSLGHGIGDRLLAHAAERVRSAVRTSDTVARLGGDEFAILLEDPVEDNGPEAVAERVVHAFADPIVIDDRAFAVSASVGAALSFMGISCADELIRNADVAMYAAKAQGKSRWTRFEPDMHAAIQKRLELKTSLMEALSSGDQMELYYQPIVDLETRQPLGVEALLRWNHPRHGLVPPLEFLPLAEESGLIIGLGSWVLRQALVQLATWRARHPLLSHLTMSVNVSGRQLDDPGFLTDLHVALMQSGVPPSMLVLEVTESILMRQTDDTVLKLSNLKAIGLRLAIDDFGTGYSSLGYLQHFPVDILKVDRSFVTGIADQSRQAALAAAVVRMGQTLELQTVAEGVEDEEQAAQLLALGCPFAQGFLFAKPLPAAQCEALLVEMSTREPAAQPVDVAV